MDMHGPDTSGLFGAIPNALLSPNLKSGKEDLKLTDEEHKEIAEILGMYAPNITFQISNDNSMVMWVGVSVTCYRIDKVNGTYRVYNDIASHWKEVYHTGSFQDFKKVLDGLCGNLINILKKSKMGIFDNVPGATPAENPNKLSLSQVKTLKELVKAFNLIIGTYKKKIQEAKENDYSYVIISDPIHSMWLRIYKKVDKYHFEKTSESGVEYETVKTFDNFYRLLCYVDFYINSYSTGGPEWTTGDGQLDELISDAGFHYSGSENYDNEPIFIFMHEEGLKLMFHTSDHSLNLVFSPYPNLHQIIAFEDYQGLKDYLQKIIAMNAQGKSLKQPKAQKMTSTELLKQSELSYDKDAIDLVTHDLKYLVPNMAESVHFQHAGIGGTG